jgi:hypothetical protein
MRTRPRLLFAFATLTLAAALWPGCAHDEDVDPSLADVLFEGSASDEAWLAIDEAPLTDDPAGASWTFTPTRWSRTGAAPTFTWMSSLAGVHRRRAPDVAPALRETRRHDALARGFAELLVPVAHAHLPPVTGSVYRLIFTIPGEPKPLRVLTTDRSFTPGSAALASLHRATGPIALELVHTFLVDNRVMEGPYRVPTLSLTVE